MHVNIILMSVVLEMHKKYILGTPEKSIVADLIGLLCKLTISVSKGILETKEKTKVYISTKALKHMYDKKPAQEYDFVIKNIIQIVKYPDSIYRNKTSGVGDFVFVKRIQNEEYLCVLERTDLGLEVVSSYKIRKESYMKKYGLLWSWKDDNPSS